MNVDEILKQPGLPVQDSSGYAVYKGPHSYCSRCRVAHRSNVCPRQKEFLKNWAKTNNISIVKSTTQVCPECEKAKPIAEGDYICAQCRDKKIPKYTVTIPESRLEELRENEVSTISSVLLRHGIGFQVIPESV